MNLNVFTTEDAGRVAEAVKETDKPPEAIAQEGRERVPGQTPQVTADDLYTQVLKYVPTPLIGLYLVAVNAAISSFNGTGERVALWAIFAVFVLSVVLFLRSRKVHRGRQIAFSVLASIAWVAASPGPFQAIKDYPEVIGTFALLVITLAVVIYRPSPLSEEAVEAAKP